MRTTIAILDKKGGNAVQKLADLLVQLDFPKGTQFGLMTENVSVKVKIAEKLQEPTNPSPLAIGYAVSTFEPAAVAFEDARGLLEGNIYNPKLENELDKEGYSQNLKSQPAAKGVLSFIRTTEGDYILLASHKEEIIAARDPIGVQPLYYGETEQIAALASNKKTLRKLGITEAKSFPPGHVGIVSSSGFRFDAVKTLSFHEPKSVSMADAAVKLQKLLEKSVQLRIAGQKRVAVAFSGGVDSSIVAFLAKHCGLEVELFHVSLEGQSETEEAKRAAEELDLSIHVCLYNDCDIESAVGRVVALIEDADPLKASVGVPFYLTAQQTAAHGFQVLLAGQGADELFGGYQRYINEYLRSGDSAVRQTMFSDVANVYETNLERDEKICIFHDVDLRLPFASFEVAEFAMGLPTALKFEARADSTRKLVLRQVAQSLGLPEWMVQKPKKAVQYSTGVCNAVKRIAKKQGFTLGEYTNKLLLEAEK
jgi:asparagine synthase (glutamine-hydrolysing)